MDFTDVASLRIKILGDEAKKDLQSLKNAATDIKSELTLLENSGKKGTVAYSEMKRLQKEVNEEIKISTRNIDLQGASLNQMRAIKAQLNGELNKLSVGSAEWIAKLKEIAPVNAKIKETEAAVRGVGSEAGKQEGTWSKLGGWIKGAFIVGGVMQLINWMVDLGKSVFDLTGKFEQYRTTLKNMLGSTEIADSALAMIKKTAALTNWSVDQLTDSFIKLKSRGLLPTSKDITAISDVSNFLKKDFGQLVEAINDINNTERWNEIGIKAKTAGDKVSLTFNGVTKTVARTEAGVMSAITEFGQLNGVMGLTADISDELAGKKSNLGDKFMFLAVTLGERLKPAFHFILDLFVKGADILGRLVEASNPLGIVFEKVSFIFNKVLEVGRNLFLAAFPAFEGKSISAAQAMKLLASVLMTIPAALLTVIAAIISVVDFMRILGDGATVVGKVLTGDFTGAAVAAGKLGIDFLKLKNNAVTNFGAIGKSFGDIWKDNTKNVNKGILDWDSWVLSQKKGEKEVTETAGEEGKKRQKEAEKAAKELVKAHKEMLKEIEKSNELADKNLRSSLDDHVKYVKKTNAEELKAHEKLQEEKRENAMKSAAINDAINKVQQIKLASSQKEIDEIESRFAQKALDRELNNSLQKLEIKEREFSLLKKAGALYKEEEDKRSAEILKLKSEVADKELAIVKKSISDKEAELKKADADVKEMWDKEVEDYKKAQEKKEKKLENFLNYGLDAYGQLLEKATDYFTKIAETSESSSKRMNAAITNEFIKPMTENLNAAKALMQGDFVGAAQGLIGYFKGMWDVTIGLKKTLKEAAAVEFNKTFEADFAKLSQFNDKIKEVFGDLAGATAELQTAQNNSLEGRIAAEIKVGEKIKENYALAVEKENAYYETRRKAIEDAYTLEVQRINDKYNYINAMASIQFGAESLAIQEGVNRDLMAFVTNEETKNSVTADYQAKRNFIIASFASQIKPITEGMSQAEIDGINKATKARDEQLAKVEGWLTSELQFIIGNEGQKRKEYSATELIIQKGQENIDKLATKYAADQLARDTQRNIDLFAAENTKNAGLEAAAKTHNDNLVALGVAKDAALIASFDRLRDAMLSGYAAMEAAASAALQKGLITAAQYEELINRANTLRNLVNEPIRSYNTNIVNDFVPGINQYASGTTYVDAENRYPDGTDTVPAYLTKGERVVPPDLNKLLGGMSNEQLVASLYKPSESLTNALSNSGLSKAGASMLMNGSMINYVSGSAVKSAAMGVTMSQSSKESAASGGEGMAKNNELMAALIELIAGQTNAELKKLNDKPNLTLHDVQNAASANNNLDRISNL